MAIYIISFALIISAVYLLKKKPYISFNAKSLVLPLICMLFLACLIIFSKTAVEAAARGLNLWFDAVFPSLFPFFVASELLRGTGFIKALGILLEPVMRPLFNVPGCGSFALAMGITSGYPVGARITASLRGDGLVSKTEAERLLAFTNNSGPLFITGAVSVGIFGLPEVGIFMLLCHIASCITVGILFRFYKRQGSNSLNRSGSKAFQRFRSELLRRDKTDFSTSLSEAIKNSINLILAIGGFIILFSVIIGLLTETGFISRMSGIVSAVAAPLGVDAGVVTAVISGFFEITTGTKIAGMAGNASLIQKLTASSVIIGWAGLSVHSQVLSVIRGSDISIKPYLFGKFLQGIIAGIYTALGLKLFGSSLFATQAFSPSGTEISKWYVSFISSVSNLAAVISFLALLVFLSVVLKGLGKKTG